MKTSFNSSVIRPLVLMCLSVGAHPDRAFAATAGEQVVVVYNSKVPESRGVAEHYASRRSVPREQVVGLDLPTGEAITRTEYLERLENPLLAKLESLKLLTYGPATNKNEAGRSYRNVIDSKVRFAALCYGVPVRILNDDTLVEPGTDRLPEGLRRNGAAVDSQLSIAPLAGRQFAWAGHIPNPFYGATNTLLMHPGNGLLLVARLDGPSAAIARGLVDQALEAETNGLWGRAYFDARGLATNDNYFKGDTYMKGAAEVIRRTGFDTVFDNRPETFSPGFPMSQIAFYAGWYDQGVTGPFTRPKVEFMPGAFAYHLYSFSASTIRSTNSWVGTLLGKGASITMGCVDEPYLDGTPDISTFLFRLTAMGFTFAEAACASQPTLSWQTTVIGDPLYRPFGRSPDALQADLQARGSKLLEWYSAVAVNQRLVSGASLQEAISALESYPPARKSAVLTEKLADLYWARGAMIDSIDTYEVALRRGPSPVQRMRLLLTCAEKRGIAGPDETAIEHYRTFLKENPDYPERLKILQLMLPIAKRRSMTNEMTRIEAEMQKLAPAAPGESPAK